MGKLTIIFYGVVIVVLILFGMFSYLMTTVNPGQLPDVNGPGETKILHYADADDAVTQSETTVTTTETAGEPAGLMKLLDYEGEERTSADRKTMNLTDTKKPKGRRSINQRSKKNPGVVIMKIVDSEGKPRLEIVFYTKKSNNDSKRYKRLNALESKRPKTNLLGHSVLNIMPDDSIVFENKDVSCNRDLEHELTSSADISDKTEATEKVFNIKKNSSNLIKPSGHNKTVTKLYSVLPVENPHETVTPKMEMNTNSKEKQTESITGVLVDKNDVLLHSTSPNFITAGWNIANIGISKTESVLGTDVSEEVTEINMFLPSATQDPSIESLQGNVITKMNMSFSEESHAISNEDISTRNTDNLVNSTSLNDNTASWDKEVRIDQNKSNTDVFDPEDQGINFTTASNLNNGSGTKPDEFLTSVQDTSAIKGSHANVTIEMDMDFSEEVHAKPYTDEYLNMTDNLFHSTGTNFTTVSFIQENIGINNNKSNSDVFETKGLESISTTSIFSERETKSNTVLMSPVQETSPKGENVTPKMDFSEELQTISHEDVSVKDTDNLFESTSTNIIAYRHFG